VLFSIIINLDVKMLVKRRGDFDGYHPVWKIFFALRILIGVSLFMGLQIMMYTGISLMVFKFIGVSITVTEAVVITVTVFVILWVRCGGRNEKSLSRRTSNNYVNPVF